MSFRILEDLFADGWNSRGCDVNAAVASLFTLASMARRNRRNHHVRYKAMPFGRGDEHLVLDFPVTRLIGMVLPTGQVFAVEEWNPGGFGQRSVSLSSRILTFWSRTSVTFDQWKLKRPVSGMSANTSSSIVAPLS